jgi:hypothetical protein
MILCVFTTADGKISQPVAVHETRHGRPDDYLCFPLRADLPLFVTGELPAPYCRVRRYRYEGWSRGGYQYVEELSGDDKLVDALLRANQSLADKARRLEEKLLQTKNAVDLLRERL